MATNADPEQSDISENQKSRRVIKVPSKLDNYVLSTQNTIKAVDIVGALTIKINPYCLDKLSKVNFKLNNLDFNMKVSPKACGRQHSVKVNSVTYQIIMQNLACFGNLLGGMEIKRADTDKEGENVQIQYYLSINGNLPVSVTCYHTTNNILLQLRASEKTKNKMNNADTGMQVQLSYFVNKSFKVMVQTIEASTNYQKMKAELGSALRELKKSLEARTGSSIPLLSPKVHIQKVQVGDLISTGGDSDDDAVEDIPGADFPDAEVLEITDITKGLTTTEATPTCNKEQFVTKINELKTLLCTKEEEIKVLNSQLQQCNKEVKNNSHMQKSYANLEEKLEKVTKLRDQMSAAVQTLKQENSVLKGQLETSNSRIDTLNDTLGSYKTISSNYEKKIQEKDQVISNQKLCIAEQDIKIGTHRELAFTFMDELVEDSQSQVQSNSKDECISTVCCQLKNQVEAAENEAIKSKEKDTQINSLREHLEDLNVQKNEIQTRFEQYKEECIQREEISKSSKKEKDQQISKLKQTLSDLEANNSLLTQETSNLKKEMCNLNAQVELKQLLLDDVLSKDGTAGNASLESKENPDLDRQQRVHNSLETESKAEEEYKKCLLELTNKVELLEAENDTLKKNNSEEVYEKCVADLRNEIGLLRGENNAYKTDVIRLEKENRDHACSYGENLEALEKAINESKETTGEKIALVSKLRKIIDEKQSEINEVMKHSTFLEKSLTEKTSKIKELLESISKQQNEIVITKENSKKCHEKLNAVSSDHRELNVKIKSCEEQINQLLHLNKMLKEKDKSSNKPQQPNVVAMHGHVVTPVSHSKDTELVLDSRNCDETQGAVDSKELCFTELRNKGSCNRGNACRYSHVIPQRLRENKDEANEIIMNKNLCVNEFRCEGSCLKRENCKFNHKITQSQRADYNVTQAMERKYNRIRGRNSSHAEQMGRAPCRYEMAKQGTCQWGNQCRFSHGSAALRNNTSHMYPSASWIPAQVVRKDSELIKQLHNLLQTNLTQNAH